MKKNISTLALFGFTLLISFPSTSQDFYHPEIIQEVKIYFNESNWATILAQFYDAGNEERLLGSVAFLKHVR